MRQSQVVEYHPQIPTEKQPGEICGLYELRKVSKKDQGKKNPH